MLLIHWRLLMLSHLQGGHSLTKGSISWIREGLRVRGESLVVVVAEGYETYDSRYEASHLADAYVN